MMYHERRDLQRSALKTPNARKSSRIHVPGLHQLPDSRDCSGDDRGQSRRASRAAREPRRCVAGADRDAACSREPISGRTARFRALGTWLGVNDAGLTVAVTNRNDGELPLAEQYRSRGLLAVDLLQYDNPGGAACAARSQLEGADSAARTFWSPISQPRSSCTRLVRGACVVVVLSPARTP